MRIPSRLALIAVGTLAAGSAIAAATVAGYALGHPETVEVSASSHDQWTMKDISDENVSYLLANLLPYYRVDPPKWCPEDDTCWIGTNADGRTDRQIMDSLACNVAESSANYTYAKVPAKDLAFIRDGLCKDSAPMIGEARGE